MALPQKDIEKSIGGWFGSTPSQRHSSHDRDPKATRGSNDSATDGETKEISKATRGSDDSATDGETNETILKKLLERLDAKVVGDEFGENATLQQTLIDEAHKTIETLETKKTIENTETIMEIK